MISIAGRCSEDEKAEEFSEEIFENFGVAL